MMLEDGLVLSAYLFSIGIYGLITSRNMVRALMCLELILNAVNINFVTFSDFFDSRQLKGNIFSIFVIAIAAAEAAIGPAIVSSIYRNRKSTPAAQLLIYVGAINVLILFAVMFMNGSEYHQDFHLFTVGGGITLMVCTSIFVSLITTIPDTSWYGLIWTTRPNQIIEQDLISTSQQIGVHLSTDFFLPFELISIILLAALIAALNGG
ncbi:hypothetical protein Ahy_B06g082486 [Arachis hypogaea]|uniref:NAD(P)H-quinone oxidoreductase subunit 6, chloroplastic n=1 Tax=Arachis hypogaea TaxID=3818 RepID=A0A444YNR9_ARAHY|nr:hypothetical protein Ahy_B06g082486 [Arachis hypogaea]